MKFKSLLLIVLMNLPILSGSARAQKADQSLVQTGIGHHYSRTNYANQSIELKNAQFQLRMFKRIGGWGWGEISTGSGKFMAVLDHLGEVMLRDQDIPMRLEANDVTRSNDGQSLIFQVKSVVVKEKLKGTSFEEWMSYPFDKPCITGKVTLTLDPEKPLVHLKYRLVSTGNYFAQYIRGPWLKVGESAFGTKKEDAIFPGVEWVFNDEWSSGTDWFKDPWALRSVPNPYKVAIPMMAVSYQGTGIGLSWEPNQVAARWFNNRSYRPQPVFATPNFVDRMNNSLMGIMIPDATGDGNENQVYASHPVELRIGEMINFDAEIWLSEGNSMAVVTDWVKRHGLPDLGQPRWSFKETLDRIANAYNTNFWHEGEGFGITQRAQDRIDPSVPEFLVRYINENKNTTLAKELQKKVDWCNSQSAGLNKKEKPNSNALEARGNQILKLQKEDGSFRFDPDGRHYMKDDFRVATSFIEPMGLAGDSALDICLLPTMELLQIAQKTNSKTFKDAAKKGIDYCMHMTRPEAGDFWETPLHAPNLLAAGHAAIACYQAYKAFGDEHYKEKAIYWIRSILPFTQLWEPADSPMLYCTKPCLCSSDWYFANWVRDHVQWEVLAVFAASSKQGINWSEVDKEIDWKRFHQGVTTAALRWMVVHTDDTWRPHNLPSSYEAYQHGDFDYCFADTHNSTTGYYAGMLIMPLAIADNIYAIIDNEKK